jgi:hypothetical protein
VTVQELEKAEFLPESLPTIGIKGDSARCGYQSTMICWNPRGAILKTWDSEESHWRASTIFRQPERLPYRAVLSLALILPSYPQLRTEPSD